jgi:hypothetical protein
MSQNQLEFIFKDKNLKEIIIRNKKAPLVIILVLSAFMIIGFILPLISTVFMISNGDGIKIGIIIIYFIGWLSGIYLLRLILWNLFGKEHFQFSINNLTYYADYKWFKGPIKTMVLDNLTVSTYEDPNTKKGNKKLKFISKDNEIKSVIQLPESIINNQILNLNF